MDETTEKAPTFNITEKWGRPVAERGFAQVPNYLLSLNQFIAEEHRLTPVELLLLIQLVGAWWRKGDLPFPSMRTLALRCGVSERQIQRAVKRLEAGGLIQKVNRRTRGIIASNAYDLTPLVTVLNDVTKAFPNAYPRSVDRRNEQGAALTEKPEKPERYRLGKGRAPNTEGS